MNQNATIPAICRHPHRFSMNFNVHRPALSRTLDSPVELRTLFHLCRTVAGANRNQLNTTIPLFFSIPRNSGALYYLCSSPCSQAPFFVRSGYMKTLRGLAARTTHSGPTFNAIHAAQFRDQVGSVGADNGLCVAFPYDAKSKQIFVVLYPPH